MSRIRITAFTCIKDGEYRLSLLRYTIKKNGHIDKQSRKEIFWMKSPSLEDILKEIPKNISHRRIFVHKGVRLSKKTKMPLTTTKVKLSTIDCSRIEKRVNAKKLAA